MRMTEDELQRGIIDTAHALGWLVHHDRGRMAGHVEGDPGYPDLAIAKAGITLHVECKADGGRFRPGQEAWLRATRGAVVTPATYDSFLRWFRAFDVRLATLADRVDPFGTWPRQD